MALTLYVTGKTREKFFLQSEEEYLKRLTRYAKLNYRLIPAAKSETTAQAEEGEALLSKLSAEDFLVILDEKGTEMNSRGFATQLNHWLSHQTSLVFAIGGAFGFSDKVKQRANAQLALSRMTFPHHLVRTIFLEQLYRAFTILKGGKYHNE